MSSFPIERHLEVGGSLPIEADVKSVEAVDEKTVEITLGTAYTPFLSELANFSNGIIPKDFGGKTEEEFFQESSRYRSICRIRVGSIWRF